jgi:predicted RNase H-like nuclease
LLGRRFKAAQRAVTLAAFIPSDDQFDAIVAWFLAKPWYHREEGIVLLRDSHSGVMLLPNTDGLQEAYTRFESREAKKRKNAVS